MSSGTIQRLKTQVGQLQKKLNATKKPIAERNVFEAENIKLKAENIKLKAEVDRLTKVNNEVISVRDELRRQLDAEEVSHAN